MIRIADLRPASVTEAVPWMSSLNVQTRSWYLCSRRKALALAKSSNWMSTPGKTSFAAVTNSSTSASYSGPRTRRRLWPM